MNTQEFFKKWTSTRPNLKASFHDAGIEAMAFADAYYKHKLSERIKSTETQNKHETEQLNILGVVRSFSEIQDRIKELTEEKEDCLLDYVTANEKEQELIANKVVQIKLRIKELEWIIS